MAKDLIFWRFQTPIERKLKARFWGSKNEGFSGFIADGAFHVKGIKEELLAYGYERDRAKETKKPMRERGRGG